MLLLLEPVNGVNTPKSRLFCTKLGVLGWAKSGPDDVHYQQFLRGGIDSSNNWLYYTVAFQ